MGYVEWSRKFEYSSVTEKDFNFKRMNAEIETAVQENLHPENNKIIITGNKKVRQDFYKVCKFGMFHKIFIFLLSFYNSSVVSLTMLKSLQFEI